MAAVVWGSRRRKVVAVLGGALAVTAVAVAAVIVYSGVNGSGNGSFEAAQAATALTVTGVSNPTLTLGGGAPMDISVNNNDPTTAHHLDTLTGTFTSTPSQCASHLSLSVPAQVLANYQPGVTQVATAISVNSDVTTPTACAGGTWSVAFAGTTTP